MFEAKLGPDGAGPLADSGSSGFSLKRLKVKDKWEVFSEAFI